ncbi:hypothetical protein [[Clostridium] colinum]|uniref:hypothetical protein n=1 Tax=[Clostridium] colinum TaxID=36835 RepID=UPI00202482AC|nr:hypothetical protein [[Clostridium] colinum]
MSLFLGPIHYWLYNKISLQNKIINNILEELKISDLNIILDEKFGCLEDKPLENMIDTQNIHGWLQEKVDLVENKLAYVVKYSLEQDKNNLEKIKNIFYSFGSNIDINGDKNDASVVFKAIEDNLLDGMPCDRAKVIINKSNSSVKWEKNICVHKKYWDIIGIDIDIYYSLVDEFMCGILSNTKFTLEHDENNIFIIE